jgi:hypothetical protein
MKFLITTALLACVTGLTACATPAADPAAEGALASSGAVFEDKGEVLTGSRIPQKSTTHVLKRVGSAEYKKARQDANSGNVEASGSTWGK